MMSLRGLGVVALTVVWFTGCSSVYLAYQPDKGQQQATVDATQRAVLVNAEDSHIWILVVDGKRNGVPSHGQYQFLPGRHTIRVQYYWPHGYMTWTGNDLADYSLDVKEGAALRVMCQHTEEPGYGSSSIYKGTWKFWIEDASNGEIVATEDSRPIVTREATGEQVDSYFWSFLRRDLE